MELLIFLGAILLSCVVSTALLVWSIREEQ